MNKTLILFGFFIVCIYSVIGSCPNNIQPFESCQLITPVINCSSYNYYIQNSNGNTILAGNLSDFGMGTYQFNFQEPEGKYNIILCDSSNMVIYVGNDNSFNSTEIKEGFNLLGDNTFIIFMGALLVIFLIFGVTTRIFILWGLSGIFSAIMGIYYMGKLTTSYNPMYNVYMYSFFIGGFVLIIVGIALQISIRMQDAKNKKENEGVSYPKY